MRSPCIHCPTTAVAPTSNCMRVLPFSGKGVDLHAKLRYPNLLNFCLPAYVEDVFNPSSKSRVVLRREHQGVSETLVVVRGSKIFPRLDAWGHWWGIYVVRAPHGYSLHLEMQWRLQCKSELNNGAKSGNLHCGPTSRSSLKRK